MNPLLEDKEFLEWEKSQVRVRQVYAEYWSHVNSEVKVIMYGPGEGHPRRTNSFNLMFTIKED